MSGYSKSSSSKKYLPDTSVEYANKLNEFLNRFDKHDFSDEIRGLRTTLENKIKSESEIVFQVSEHEVCHEFRRLNITISLRARTVLHLGYCCVLVN